MKGIEIKKKLQNNGFSLKKVAELMGETPQNLNSMLSAQDIKTGVVERIAKSINKSLYFFLNEKVELMNEAEMAQYDRVDLPVAIQDKKGIPHITHSVAAGFGNADFSITEQDVKDYYTIPMFKYLRIDFMIDVRGSSMIPKYNSGDIIACTIIHERTFIQWNKCHIIATREQGILVKRIRQSTTEGYIVAGSDNKEYPPFEIPESEITGIALVVGVVRLE